MKQVLEDLKIQCECPMKLFCDNKLTMSIAHNPVQHDRRKHIKIKIDQYFINEKLDNEFITIAYIPFGHQSTDLLTKDLLPEQLN